MTSNRLEFLLKDKTPVVARPLNWDDRDYVSEGYRRLSPEARYQRFWVRDGEVIGESMLHRLLSGQPPQHAIWTIYDPKRSGYPALGAASFWQSREDPTEAEISATVLDDDQGRGVGTDLLAILWLVALHHDITRFVGYTMPENVRALRWMRDTGGQGFWDGYQAVFNWQLDNLDALPETSTAAHLASRLAEFADSLWIKPSRI